MAASAILGNLRHTRRAGDTGGNLGRSVARGQPHHARLPLLGRVGGSGAWHLPLCPPLGARRHQARDTARAARRCLGKGTRRRATPHPLRPGGGTFFGFLSWTPYFPFWPLLSWLYAHDRWFFTTSPLGYDLYLGVLLGAVCTALHLAFIAPLRVQRGMRIQHPAAIHTQDRTAVEKAEKTR